MKSNLYSIFIFLIGLFATYIVTNHYQQLELTAKNLEISIQSQAISHTVKQQITSRTQSLSAVAQRWQSIKEINNNWQSEIRTLNTLHPNLSNINIYLIKEQPTLTIDKKNKQHFITNTALMRNAQWLAPLDKQLNYSQKTLTFLSSHIRLNNDNVGIYLQAPIFVEKQLIGYLDARLNISKLLNEQVATFQITHPFSLSETGRSLYTLLPQNVHINDVKHQFDVPILNHHWKLIVWASHQHHFYQYIPFIGLILSILFSLLTYLVHCNKEIQKRLAIQKAHLMAINKDFSASKSKLVQSNKLSSLGEIATGIAHEINQPLQVICIHADLCQESLQKQNYRLVDKSFRSILSQIERIEKIVKQVGSFGRDSELDNYNQEVPATIFENVINIVINQYNQESVELRQVLPPSLPSVFCNKTQIEQVLVNLLINAKDAVEESDEKVVFIKAHDKQGKLYIEVSDSGSGIEPSKLDDIFTPFYTTKALGKGTGLGLSISYSIIHQHKGEFQVSSEIGKGSTFTVILPLN